MTTAIATDTAIEQERPDDATEESSQESQTPWQSAIVRAAQHLASPDFPPEDLANLAYRFTTRSLHGDAGAFWRVLIRCGAPYDHDRPRSIEAWAVLIKGTARITRSLPSNAYRHPNPHNPARPMGRILYLGDDAWTSSPEYPEHAMQLLLTATGNDLMRHATRTLECIAQSHANCDLRHMAALLEADIAGCRRQTDEARLTIAQPYYALLGV